MITWVMAVMMPVMRPVVAMMMMMVMMMMVVVAASASAALAVMRCDDWDMAMWYCC